MNPKQKSDLQRWLNINKNSQMNLKFKNFISICEIRNCKNFDILTQALNYFNVKQITIFIIISIS